LSAVPSDVNCLSWILKMSFFISSCLINTHLSSLKCACPLGALLWLALDLVDQTLSFAACIGCVTSLSARVRNKGQLQAWLNFTRATAATSSSRLI
jgi:deoxyribodipyrimidine photolyase-like uncharacterized protein